MKVYVQDIKTGRFFQSPFVWVEDQVAAYDFVTSLEAFDFCLQNEGNGTRILLSFEDSRANVCLFSMNDNSSPVTPLSQPIPLSNLRPVEQEPQLAAVS